jgi:hypothetical protein
MLKLTDIFKLLLFVGTLLTSKVLSAQSFNSQFSINAHVIKSSCLNVNHDDSFVVEDNDVSKSVKYYSANHFANSSKSFFYDFGLIKREFPQIFLEKITTPLHRLNHLFIFFHCWKFLFC